MMLIINLVFINNHTTVWGSWFDSSSGTWGYACCHSTIHVSYCSGLAGIEATHASDARSLLSIAEPPVASSLTTKVLSNRDERTSEIGGREQNYSKQRVGEGNVKLDLERLAQAISEEKKRKFKADGDDNNIGRKKKSIQQSGAHEVTEEELGESELLDPWYIIELVALVL
jgi:pre-mRNA-processing factor SLU7